LRVTNRGSILAAPRRGVGFALSGFRTLPTGTQILVWQRQIPLPVTSRTSPPTKPFFFLPPRSRSRGPCVRACGSIPQTSRFRAGRKVACAVRRPISLAPLATTTSSTASWRRLSLPARPPACLPIYHAAVIAYGSDPCACGSVGHGRQRDGSRAELRQCRRRARAQGFRALGCHSYAQLAYAPRS
jgi:hypothetical protein